MAHTVPASVPAALRAGDTATWQRALADYPASEGWTLDYILVNAAGQIAIAADADHLVEVSAATTALWIAGTYSWQERASLAGKTYTTATGSVEVLANLAAATSGIDVRTHAQRTLAALEAWIESHDLAVAKYAIGDRSLDSIPIADLLKLRDTYRKEVRGQSGKSGRVYMRF